MSAYRRMLSHVLGAFIFCTTSYCYFYINNEVRNLSREMENISSAINYNKEMVHILKAEWAFTSNPQRIENMTKKYLRGGITNQGKLNVSDNCMGSSVMVLNQKNSDSRGR